MLSTADASATAIDRYLRGFITRRRMVIGARAVTLAVTFAMLWMALCCLADRPAGLPGYIRLVMLIAGCVCTTLIAAGSIAIGWHRYDPVAAASEIEAYQPVFDERLITVASQQPAQSNQLMLNSLREEVNTIIRQCKGRAPVSLKPMRLPMLGAGAVSVAIMAMFLSTRLNFPLLLHRFFQPLASLPPVTITQLHVRPGSVSLVDGDSLLVSAAIEQADHDAVALHVSDDDRSWTQQTIPPAEHAAGMFSLSLPSLHRDLRYFVTAGDAVSPTYDVRVLRPPAVVEFRIHCEPPAALHRPAFNQVSIDGDFSAPIGSRVTIELVSTEPLQHASIAIDHEELELSPTANPLIRQAKLTLHGDVRYQPHLTGINGITTIASHMSVIRAIRNRDSSQRPEVPGYDEQLKSYFQALNRAMTTQPAR